MAFSLANIALELGGEVHGDENCQVERIATLANATADCISFLTNPKYRDQLADCQAAAVLIHPNQLEYCQANCAAIAVVLDNPYLGYAMLAQLMDTTPTQSPGIAPSATVAHCADVAITASIGDNAVISKGAVIGENVTIGSGCFVGENSVIGESTRLWSNVSVYHDVSIGRDCLFQSGAVIGSDGFGYAPNRGQWVKIPQLGGVTIGDRVEIGANSCIDRGALDNTVIGDGVIIDNLCHIAHNVIIGNNTAMAGGAMVAGSTSIGSGCAIAGKVGIGGHLTVTDNVMLTANAIVLKDIKEAGSYSSGMTSMPSQDWRRVNARIKQLDLMHQKMRQQDKDISRLKSLLQQQNK
ncbi:MAG: UDP-3-O-[3-hydroxymyristoyl] glucosamine N-acyltransferase [Phenylobacterium sp.]|jgi:UDP-3-O-[3-hydroxymyristoyl] glucosamine N-acyltransferase